MVDNGKEFEALGITAKRMNVKLYKCDPYCSFQRGANERANALVRRFIPKGKSMYNIEQQYLDDISAKDRKKILKPNWINFHKQISIILWKINIKFVHLVEADSKKQEKN